MCQGSLVGPVRLLLIIPKGGLHGLGRSDYSCRRKNRPQPGVYLLGFAEFSRILPLGRGALPGYPSRGYNMLTFLFSYVVKNTVKLLTYSNANFQDRCTDLIYSEPSTGHILLQEHFAISHSPCIILPDYKDIPSVYRRNCNIFLNFIYA